mmetsp:Transcript_10301/g.31497  ORF Transcript_10301/g.31497 Transcript_10301/m.31497 type:complete len:201 (-) Transcript_10301:81-683(-)
MLSVVHKLTVESHRRLQHHLSGHLDRNTRRNVRDRLGPLHLRLYLVLPRVDFAVCVSKQVLLHIFSQWSCVSSHLSPLRLVPDRHMLVHPLNSRLLQHFLLPVVDLTFRVLLKVLLQISSQRRSISRYLSALLAVPDGDMFCSHLWRHQRLHKLRFHRIHLSCSFISSARLLPVPLFHLLAVVHTFLSFLRIQVDPAPHC